MAHTNSFGKRNYRENIINNHRLNYGLIIIALDYCTKLLPQIIALAISSPSHPVA
ncbi:MAG: hypothetical protein MJE68_07870 [Proteobacteria bacterium]|nr:hypothetical protein [Pseudomonadota bacterium]